MNSTYELQASTPTYSPPTPKMVITDEMYFTNLDNQVRDKFKDWEVLNMLPAVKMIMGRAKIPELALLDYPVEGYYYKTPELKELFKKIRNIQQNPDVYTKIHDDDMLGRLRATYDSDLFGISPVTGYPWPGSPLKRRWDILTKVMQSEEFDDKIRKYPWTIPSVMEAVKKTKKGMVNLVELAALIGNPKLLTAAAETSCLGRMYAQVTGSYCMRSSYKTEYVWAVKKEVEELGTKIVEAYNKTMDANTIQYENKIHLVAAHESNMYDMVWGYLELPRVAHLGYVMATQKNYFWILDYGEELYDYYTTDFITTENYYEKRSTILKELGMTK